MESVIEKIISDWNKWNTIRNITKRNSFISINEIKDLYPEISDEESIVISDLANQMYGNFH